MRPYREPWSLETPPERRQSPSALGLALAFAAMAIAGVLAQCHFAYRVERLESQMEKLRASQEAANAALELEIAEARRSRTEVHEGPLPQCVCAPGDPLCSEIPGETCDPHVVAAPTTGHR